MRLIDADALKENAREWLPEIVANKNPFVVMGLFDLIDNLADNMPTIDPVKRGKWIKISDRNYKCSCCGAWWTVDRDSTIKDFKFCPNCGAQIERSEE